MIRHKEMMLQQTPQQQVSLLQQPMLTQEQVEQTQTYHHILRFATL